MSKLQRDPTTGYVGLVPANTPQWWHKQLSDADQWVDLAMTREKRQRQIEVAMQILTEHYGSVDLQTIKDLAARLVIAIEGVQ